MRAVCVLVWAYPVLIDVYIHVCLIDRVRHCVSTPVNGQQIRAWDRLMHPSEVWEQCSHYCSVYTQRTSLYKSIGVT